VNLKKSKRLICERTSDIFDLLGGQPPILKNVLISETMRLGLEEAVGVWESREERNCHKAIAAEKLARLRWHSSSGNGPRG
jgi:hypothetical protein